MTALPTTGNDGSKSIFQWTKLIRLAVVSTPATIEQTATPKPGLRRGMKTIRAAAMLKNMPNSNHGARNGRTSRVPSSMFSIACACTSIPSMQGSDRRGHHIG